MSSEKITIERQPKSRVIATLTFTAEERAKAEQEALQAFAEKVDIKGFRVGHAPADMVKGRVPQEQLLEETVRALVRTILPEVVTEHKLQPVIPPRIEIASTEPLTVRLVFIEKPVVKMKNIDTLSIKKKDVKADPKDVERVIDSILNDHRTAKDVEREAKENDRLTIDFHAVDMDGKEIDGMRATGYTVLIGSNTLLPGFEEQLKGLKLNDRKTFTLTLPEKFQAEHLRGKQATFHVAVTRIEETQLPTLTDEFAKEKLNAGSAADFRATIEKSITVQEEQLDRMSRERELMDEIRKRTDAEIADELLDEEMRGMINEWGDRLAKQNMSIADALKKEGKTVEQAEGEMRKEAEERWKLRLGMAKLIEHKGVAVTDEEVAAMFTEFVQSVPPEQQAAAKAEFDKRQNLYDELRWRALVEKVLQGLLA